MNDKIESPKKDKRCLKSEIIKQITSHGSRRIVYSVLVLVLLPRDNDTI